MSTVKTFEQGAKAIIDTLKYHERYIKCVQDALGTNETGEALIEVARNAHSAEQELAALRQKYDDLNDTYGQEMILSANLKAELETLKRKLTEEFEGEVDINNNNGPTSAMRVINIVEGKG